MTKCKSQLFARLGSLTPCEVIKTALPSFRNASPEGVEGSIVLAERQTSMEVYDSIFARNNGTALQNFGKMIVYNSRFIDNLASQFWISEDSEVRERSAW